MSRSTLCIQCFLKPANGLDLLCQDCRTLKSQPKKKFSGGTLGRIAQHAHESKELIRKYDGDPRLAEEFIREIQSAGGVFDDRNWQRFESPQQAQESFLEWLNPPM